MTNTDKNLDVWTSFSVVDVFHVYRYYKIIVMFIRVACQHSRWIPDYYAFSGILLSVMIIPSNSAFRAYLCEEG